MTKTKSILEKMIGRRVIMEFSGEKTYSARIEECDEIFVKLVDVSHLTNALSPSGRQTPVECLDRFEEYGKKGGSKLFSQALLQPTKDNIRKYQECLKEGEICSSNDGNALALPYYHASIRVVPSRKLVKPIRTIKEIYFEE